MSATEYVSYLQQPKGIKSWLFTLDHKRIGIMYLAAIMTFFIIGGILALIIRLELLHPGKDLVVGDVGVFTHGFKYGCDWVGTAKPQQGLSAQIRPVTVA